MTQPDQEIIVQSLARKLLTAEVNHSIAEGIIQAQARRISELEDAVAEEPPTEQPS